MAIASGVIIAWPGTNASIPSGWSRKTSLDDSFPLGSAASTNPDTTGGGDHAHPPVDAHPLRRHHERGGGRQHAPIRVYAPSHHHTHPPDGGHRGADLDAQRRRVGGHRLRLERTLGLTPSSGSSPTAPPRYLLADHHAAGGIERMSRKRATWGEIKIAQARAARMEAVAEAWRARYWEVKSGGQLIPSPEDRAEHERLIGPMPQ